MKGPQVVKVGMKIDGRPPEDVPGLARLAEQAQFDEFWVCEDLGLAGGISQATAALSVTQRLDVGLGIAPAAVRNPMYLAMEFATLGRMFPQRFLPGVGHGVPEWLTQVGQRPVSLMACLEEVTDSVQMLLSGQEVSYHGRHVNLDKVRLLHPPAAAPQISLGVRGPKGIELAARLGSGLILAEGSRPEYVRSVRNVVGPQTHITVFVWSHLDQDSTAAALDEIAPTIAGALSNPQLTSQLGPWFGSDPTREKSNELAVVGDPDTCLAALGRLRDAGADSVVLQPVHGTEDQQIALAGKVLLPALTAS